VTGPTSNPILTGTLATQSMHLLAEDYSVDLSIPDDTLRVRNSYLDLNHIEAYAAGKSPLTIDGSIDFSNLERIKLSLDIAARNYNLIDAPQSRTALTYGKVYVDMNARATGTLDNLKVRGKLAVLGNTDVTYVLRDSPITVQDQLSDIVTFCDFSDTTYVQPVRKNGQSMDAMVLISIEQSAQVHCLLSEDGSDYVNLQGGGELTLTYDLENDLRLYGRYTIEQGIMRYSLMAIPLNDFTIHSGSYVEFTGDTGNPVLGISASERVKAIVTENGVPRNVAFDVGLSLSQTLQDMGLTFTLEAPEDMTVQNELSAMSTEDRGRVAVTMLVTGMYMTDDFNIKNGFSYANTLNAYLQSAINNIAGQALSTVDLSFGIENSTTSSGKTTTDYSFSFRKRFWGNRISLVLGGKVSTGEDAENTGQTIIDNVSLEYKLDNGASRYVRLFYDRNYQSLIEGELTEMGAGLVLRRRTDRLRDLFRFRKTAEDFPGSNKYTDHTGYPGKAQDTNKNKEKE
ncbi:MAG: translocation/assembly module TamB domain-containing protein, partial [Bacteroidaceae bacterium]